MKNYIFLLLAVYSFSALSYSRNQVRSFHSMNNEPCSLNQSAFNTEYKDLPNHDHIKCTGECNIKLK